MQHCNVEVQNNQTKKAIWSGMVFWLAKNSFFGFSFFTHVQKIFTWTKIFLRVQNDFGPKKGRGKTVFVRFSKFSA